jgi:hypothetical protein
MLRISFLLACGVGSAGLFSLFLISKLQMFAAGHSLANPPVDLQPN